MPVRLVLFGAPALEHDGESHALSFERRGQLLAFLAMKREWVPRAELAALLWPGQESKLAYTNLRKTLFRLQGLPRLPAVETQGSSLRFAVPTDVAAFEEALREQRTAEALALHRGPLLAGFDDDANEVWTGWLRYERDRLRTAWRDGALAQLAGELDPHEAVALSSRLLEADPLDDAALRAHLAWLARSGQAARARQAYREFAQRLDDDLGLAPSADLKALHDALSAPGASIATRDEPRAVDGGFVGRSVELRRIAEMIARAECRLLCLLGPGGVGKTRLAQRAMQDLAPRFAGGIGFVALEDVRLPRDIGARIATALGVAPAAREMPMDAVVGHLRELAFLLVLDNFEHLASDASAIEQLLAACPGLSIIVTSRVRLALPSEWVLPLEGLPCPEEEDADRLEAFDAARLFVQAARRVQPALAPAAEASAIIDICHQVEGLPLALQLAAGWTRVLSCEAIADELRRGTDLLQAADGTRGERHASFDVVFEQSWRLLTASERDVLSRLSVFRGTIAHDAARSVAGASLPVLGALVDKSLLRKEGTRLAMHPLVQQLAAARLDDERGRLTRAAHAAHFLNGLAQVAARTEEGDRATLEAIDADLENCRLAWQQATADGQGEALMRAAPALHDYFDHRARFDDGLAWFRGALEAPHARTNASARARLLGIVAHLEFRLARFLQAESTAREALSAAPSDDDVARFRALAVLASCAMDTGRLQEAAERFDEVLAIARDAGLARDLASSLENLALVHKRLGRYESSLSLSLDALSQHRRNGDTAAVALCLSNLGSLTMFMGQDEAAAKHLDEALVLSERAGLASTRAFVLANMTELAMNARDDARARQLAERALEVADGAGIRPLASWLQVQLARLAIRRGDLGDARARLAEAVDLALAVASPIPKAAPLLAFAELLEAQGHAALGRRVLAFGMQQPDLLAPSRDELRQAWEARGGAAGDEARWPELSLDQLLQRIVAEAELEHAPLRAALGATA